MEYTKFSVERLLSMYGSPLYVFDENQFIENYYALDHVMKSRYENYRAAYSFKTNYTPYICKTAKLLGAYAEVVSGMEYEIAKRIGYDDARIIFNGPEKTEEETDAFLNGCIINADNLDEVTYLCSVAKDNPEQNFKIGLRINLNIGQDFRSRFGMDEKDAAAAFRMVDVIDNLTIAGLHCHISRCRDLNSWKLRAEYMLALADRFFADSIPKYIDLGSGMFGSMEPEFAAQFDNIPTYEEYAEVTAGLFAKHYLGRKGPILFTEPGTTLVNRFVSCITRVKSIKQIDGHDFAILDADIHTLGETCMLKKLPVKVISGGVLQKKYEKIDLTGFTCLEQDIIYAGFKGKLAKGDYIVFGNTGGYSNVLKPAFIRPGCAMIAEKQDGSFVLIKRAETFKDVFQTYVF